MAVDNPDDANLSLEAARSILQLDFPAASHRRVAVLSARASAGTLTEEERAELTGFLRVADLLAILQSKAGKFLKRFDD